jgi:hypothetical protein
MSRGDSTRQGGALTVRSNLRRVDVRRPQGLVSLHRLRDHLLRTVRLLPVGRLIRVFSWPLWAGQVSHKRWTCSANLVNLAKVTL